jgi:hypothetical protein
MILLLLSPYQRRVLFDDMTNRIRRVGHDVIDDDIDHQEHVPLVQFGGQGFEIVGVSKPRVKEGRVLHPVAVVGGSVGSGDIDVLCQGKDEVTSAHHVNLGQPTIASTHCS